jgi:hypothetical protein
MSFSLAGYMSFAHFKKTNLKCMGLGFNAHASKPFLSNAQHTELLFSFFCFFKKIILYLG